MKVPKDSNSFSRPRSKCESKRKNVTRVFRREMYVSRVRVYRYTKHIDIRNVPIVCRSSANTRDCTWRWMPLPFNFFVRRENPLEQTAQHVKYSFRSFFYRLYSAIYDISIHIYYIRSPVSMHQNRNRVSIGITAGFVFRFDHKTWFDLTFPPSYDFLSTSMSMLDSLRATILYT